MAKLQIFHTSVLKLAETSTFQSFVTQIHSSVLPPSTSKQVSTAQRMICRHELMQTTFSFTAVDQKTLFILNIRCLRQQDITKHTITHSPHFLFRKHIHNSNYLWNVSAHIVLRCSGRKKRKKNLVMCMKMWPRPGLWRWLSLLTGLYHFTQRRPWPARLLVWRAAGCSVAQVKEERGIVGAGLHGCKHF